VNATELRTAVLGALHRIAPEVDLDTVADDADLRDELELDSMDFLTFIEELSTRTGVDVPEREYPSVRTLGSCVAYLGGRLGERSSTP
jgi:acyl carrier protein